jgi:hypothetical protein
MKIIKYTEFIKEELMNDTPESYIEMLLKQLKRRIDKMFEFQQYQPEVGDVETEKGKSIQKAKRQSKDRNKMSFKDMGIKLESNEVSKYSKLYDSLTVKFSDNIDSWYSLIIMIDLKEALPKEKDVDFKLEDIKTAYIKFKKYDSSTDDVIGQITKNIEIKKIDEEFLIDLKIEIDEEFGDEDESLEIETE